MQLYILLLGIAIFLIQIIFHSPILLMYLLGGVGLASGFAVAKQAMESCEVYQANGGKLLLQKIQYGIEDAGIELVNLYKKLVGMIKSNFGSRKEPTAELA